MTSTRPRVGACDGAGEWAGLVLLGSTAYGGIWALIGHSIKTDRWVEMPLDQVPVSLGRRSGAWGCRSPSRF